MSDRSRSLHKCDMDRSNRVSAFLMLWLLICVGSSPLSMVVHTLSKVGLPAVLPCTMSNQLETAHNHHIQWQTIRDSVFERMGEELFQGEAYIDRADVPKEMLMRGNCSLFLRDVRFSDAGIYESYLVVGESNIKNRVFIQSVQLAVIDHKTIKSVKPGEQLILDLYTHQAEQVIFQNYNDTSWSVLWERGAGKKGYPKERGDKLIFRAVTASSAGTYKVLDPQGLALSTMKVTVTEPVLAKETNVLQRHSALGFMPDALTQPSIESAGEHSHSHNYFGISNPPNLHVFGLMEGNWSKHGDTWKNMHTEKTPDPSRGLKRGLSCYEVAVLPTERVMFNG